MKTLTEKLTKEDVANLAERIKNWEKDGNSYTGKTNGVTVEIYKHVETISGSWGSQDRSSYNLEIISSGRDIPYEEGYAIEGGGISVEADVWYTAEEAFEKSKKRKYNKSIQKDIAKIKKIARGKG